MPVFQNPMGQKHILSGFFFDFSGFLVFFQSCFVSSRWFLLSTNHLRSTFKLTFFIQRRFLFKVDFYSASIFHSASLNTRVLGRARHNTVVRIRGRFGVSKKNFEQKVLFQRSMVLLFDHQRPQQFIVAVFVVVVVRGVSIFSYWSD